jgi:6-phosphogluconolactonase
VQSNYCMARLALVEPLGIAPANVFAIDTSLAPAAATTQYTEAIKHFFSPGQPPRLDLVLLGLGDDAHTASLFPGTSVLLVSSVGAREVLVEAKDTYRITLTAPLLNLARAVAFLVDGSEKAPAVRQVLNGGRDAPTFPAQLIVPTQGDVHWFLDEAAAAQLQR